MVNKYMKQQQGKMDKSLKVTMNSEMTKRLLPPELVQECLSRLPISSLFRSMYVNKPWHNLITEPSFFAMCVAQKPNPTTLILTGGSALYIIPDLDTSHKAIKLANLPVSESDHVEDVRLVSSLNGFICFSCLVNDRVSLFVGNPLNGDWMKVPLSIDFDDIDSADFMCDNITFGFGYNSKDKEYKVLSVIKMYNDVPKIQILTLGTTIWRNIAMDSNDVRWEDNGVFLNECLHWIVHSDTRIVGIQAFNVEEELFNVVSVPDSVNGKLSAHFDLGVLGEFLILVDHYSKGSLNVWMMKDYGVKKSWTLEFVVPISLGATGQLLGVLKNGSIVLLRRSMVHSLVSYEPKTKTFKVLRETGLPPMFDAVSHVGSLFKLTDMISIKEVP